MAGVVLRTQRSEFVKLLGSKKSDSMVKTEPWLAEPLKMLVLQSFPEPSTLLKTGVAELMAHSCVFLHAVKNRSHSFRRRSSGASISDTNGVRSEGEVVSSQGRRLIPRPEQPCQVFVATEEIRQVGIHTFIRYTASKNISHCNQSS